MNTRTASEDSDFRQEKYMGSPELERGLLANCVASRVRTITDPSQRKLIWWLQKRSWEPGGLEKVASEIMERWPERFVTPTIEILGTAPGQIYFAEEVKEARESLPNSFSNSFRRRGEERFSLWRLPLDELHLTSEQRAQRRDERAKELREARSKPNTYPASAFAEVCLETARIDFPKFLFEELCLNPAIVMSREELWYFPRWLETLAEKYEMDAAVAASCKPVTEIGAAVNETLEYALSERCLVVIDGLARTGKTTAVEEWCAAHGGEARYAEVPSHNDEISFFRVLCKALGLSASRSYKANDLRAKVEGVLQTRDLLLVLDEGHYLWPQQNVRQAINPPRINWLLTQLVNKGVPVAIVTSPQFTKSQEALVRNGGWSSEQLIGRISDYKRLPPTLSEEDLESVARHWLPEGDEKSIRLLVAYAQSSDKYLQGIEALARRSRFLARKEGREQPTLADVASALKNGVVPSDNAIAAALNGAQKPASRKAGRPRAAAAVAQTVSTPPGRAVKPSFKAAAREIQPAEETTFTPPPRDTAGAVLST